MSKISQFIEDTIEGKTSLEEQEAFLRNLEINAENMREFIVTLQKQMPAELNMPEAIDICGTGGSGLPRINTSTIAAIILASLGVKIAKHGNKAASGRFGSFDLLESLGIRIDLQKPELEQIYQELGLAFIFARSFHPAMKHFATVRKKIAHKTIFNLLGPLLNPANPKRQIIGCSSKEDMPLMIKTAKLLGKEHVLVLHGQDNLDEFTLTGPTDVLELKNGEISEYTLSPEDFGLETLEFEEISGGDQATNTKIAQSILNNNCQSQHLNLVLANVALILKFNGNASTYQEAFQLAKSAHPKELLQKYIQKSQIPSVLTKIIKEQKIPQAKPGTPQPSTRDFKAAIATPLSLICELKNASPSDSQLKENPKSLSEISAIYEENGASAISVLTEENYFHGSIENLQIPQKLPVLMKDFITDERQIYAGSSHGADAILLIAAILSKEEIDQFIKVAKSLNMDALVEVHNEEELEKVLQTSAEIIGINNRNLHTFEISTTTTLKLLSKIPEDKIVVAESGYTTQNVALLPNRVNAALIGTSLMKSPDIKATLKELKSPRRLLKICGLRKEETAKFCEEQKIPLVGLNFVPTSKRHISLEEAQKIRPHLKNTLAVGVFQNQPLQEVQEIANALSLDYVQLSGDEDPEYCSQIHQPIIKTITSDQEASHGASLYIIDGKEPGSGQQYDYSKINSQADFLVAGGVNPENAQAILEQVPNAKGLDVASGIETDGEIDHQKIIKILELC